MNTLQRSSCSFRRQGSSGRIWDKNVVQIPEVKPPAPTRENSRDFRYQYCISDSNLSNTSEHDPPPPSRSERKAHRCAFLSIFVHCVRSPAS
ncbi:hypothetical protein C2S51_006118 [Perilla frutescens var. frutescens]|nr:hypothetical protein C2S51_006118 [Perilla frutescens var. frutescens]